MPEAPGKERYQDARSEVEIVVGKSSRRVYQFTFRIDGPNIKGGSTTTFDYKTPVVIKPPK